MTMSQDARRDEETSTQRRARILGLSYFDTSAAQKQLYKDILTTRQLYHLKAVPLRADAHHIHFGVTNTTSQQTMKHLRDQFLDQQVSFSLISDTGYREYMRLYDPPKPVVYHDIDLKSAGSEDLVARVSTTLEQVRADDMLAYLVQQAHRLNSSDIHIETQQGHVRVRFRIDGVLHPIARLSREKYRILIAAIASAGNVSTASDEGQQGHIRQKVSMADGTPVDVNVRLETVPAINGMDVVMRLFNMSQEMYQLEKLGLSEDELAVVEDIIRRPSGLLLVVGPTGSGKTTTLYSILNSLNSDERKIITIEDPVEFQFDGIVQIPAHSQSAQETRFAEKLRAVLRLDPDVIMVGEIRDLDTARTALQAALTGHLVLATFHAGSATAALTRLSEIIGQNPLFVSAIRLVMAQRLVRRLDDQTKQPAELDDAMRERVRQVIETLPANAPRPDLAAVTVYAPGRSADNPYGFSGQLAIREQFIMREQVRRLLESAGTVSSEQIEAAAIASGMRTMEQDGVLKALAGLTTLDEVYRVIG